MILGFKDMTYEERLEWAIHKVRHGPEVSNKAIRCDRVGVKSMRRHTL